MKQRFQGNSKGGFVFTVYCRFYNTPVKNISTPIKMRIAPPKIEDLSESRVPQLFPIFTPALQITKVTAAMIAAACQQYKICDTGDCPVGVATQDEELRKRLKIETAAKRVENYLKVSTEELKTFARITGHDDVHDLNIDDLCTINSEISKYTCIKHV